MGEDEGYTRSTLSKEEALLYAATVCREYRDVCIEHDHFLNLYNWYLAQRNTIDEALEKRHTSIIIDLDLELRVMSGAPEGCVCDLRKISDTNDVKCRKTGPQRAILEKEMKRVKDSYENARERKWSLHYTLFSFLFHTLYEDYCKCETAEPGVKAGTEPPR